MIDALITQAAAEGRLHALTVWKNERGYQANVQRTAGNSGWSSHTDADPVKAILAVLTPPGRPAGPPPVAPAEPKPGLFD